MALHRFIYITFYILYLIFLSVGIHYLLIYTNSASWVAWLFISGFILAGIGVFIKEFLLKHIVTCCERDVTQDINACYKYWMYIYIILHIIAFILIIAGVVFAIINSTLPWYVWVLLGLAIILYFIGSMILALYPLCTTLAITIYTIAFILYIIALVLLVVYGPNSLNLNLTLSSTFWLWIFIAVGILLGLLAVLFEGLSDMNACVIPECSPCPIKQCAPCEKKLPECCPSKKCDPCSI